MYDYKELTRRIEGLLPDALGSKTETVLPKAIAKIGQIQRGSLADQLGLLTGDLIICFGSLNHGSHESVKGLACFSEEVVKHREMGCPLNVKIERSGTIISFSMDTSQSLGFQILPLN